MSDAGFDAGSSDANLCAPVWIVDRSLPAGTSSSATVADGALLLSEEGFDSSGAAMHSPVLAIKVLQQQVSGDFDATFKIEDFVAGGRSAAVVMFVTGEGIFEARSTLRATSPGLLLASNVGGMETFITGPESTSGMGTLRIQRVGSMFTVTTSIGDFQHTLSDDGVSGEVSIGIGVRAGEDETMPSSVRVTDFTITGGGVRSDSFDCDTVIVES